MHMGFNAAFAYGVYSGGSVATGAACTIRAVEEMSNLRIDAYVTVDFRGFVGVVDAVGGADVTLQCRIWAPEAAGLDLPAGVVHLDGRTAVNVARARTGMGLGDGSDLQRINRQHALFNAIFDKVYAMNVVTDFPKLYSMVAEVLGSVMTDMGNLADIAGFAYSLKNFNTNNITFSTIPIGSAGNGANVVILDYLAEPVWEALRNDQPLPGEEPEVEPDPGSVESSAPVYGPPLPPEPAAPPSIQQDSDCY